MVRAIFDFCPSVSEELPLFVGDIIEVLAVVDEFWLLGKKEDVTVPQQFCGSCHHSQSKRGRETVCLHL